MPHVFATGDTHGEMQMGRLSSKGWPEGRKLTKEDYLIITGDFGILWKNEPDDTEQYWIKWLNEKKWTTIFVCGNHENHLRLQSLPIIEKFGGKVGKVSDSIFYLRRGEIYTIYEKTFFCFGGALSWDRQYRKLNVSYWEEEVPSSKEMEYAVENLKKVDNKVDYVIAHTIPQELIPIIGFSKADVDPTRNFLDFIAKNIQYQDYYCGHMHIDKDIGKFHLLWDRIIQIF
jgi:hypothetical protein